MNELTSEWVEKADNDFYSATVRYPGVKVSVELAEDAFELAKRVRQFVRSKLELK